MYLDNIHKPIKGYSHSSKIKVTFYVHGNELGNDEQTPIRVVTQCNIILIKLPEIKN